MPPTRDASAIHALVTAALAAPSGDNCQPWRFAWDGQRLSILFDADRAESLYDVEHAASWMGLGAALVNLRLTALALGLESRVELFPHGAPGVVARVQLQPCAAQANGLAQAVAARCSNRRPYAGRPLANADREALGRAIRDVPDVWLDLMEDAAVLAQVAVLSASNDRILFENRRLHDGLYRWLRWSDADSARTGDGLPVRSLELRGPDAWGFRLLGSWPVARLFARLGLTRGLPARSIRIYRRSSAFGLVTVRGTRPEDFVRAGEAFERIWLTATDRGLALQPIGGLSCLLLRCRLRGGEGLDSTHQAIVARAGEQLARLAPRCAQQTPAMLFRVGYAPAPSGRAPRRPAAGALQMAGPAAQAAADAPSRHP